MKKEFSKDDLFFRDLIVCRLHQEASKLITTFKKSLTPEKIQEFKKQDIKFNIRITAGKSTAEPKEKKNPCGKCLYKYNREMIRDKDRKIIYVCWCTQYDKPCREIKSECGKFVHWQ